MSAIGSNSVAWHTLTLSSPLSVQAGSYWLAFSYAHSNEDYYYNTNGGQSSLKSNDATTNGFTSTWGASSASNAYQVSIYATISATTYAIDLR